MIERVNPSHPDKIADRIAGAIVDLAYRKEDNPKVAVEVLIGHGKATIIIESSVRFTTKSIYKIVKRIAGLSSGVDIIQVPQDKRLAHNQEGRIRCGDNGIFKGEPLTDEERRLSEIARAIYGRYRSDGKYILAGMTLIICQSNANSRDLWRMFPNSQVNPLGPWTGGTSVDSGATNRKLGSDMGHSVTGGGIHGKDLSKADVSANIYAFLKAQETGERVEMCCAIGDEEMACFIGGRFEAVPYSDVVETARRYIKSVGGFEKFAEWGLF